MSPRDNQGSILAVTIGTLELKNPVLAASGTFGFGEEYADFVSPETLGGIVLKGLTPEPKAGNPPPRIAETPAGMLNAIGLENPGIERFKEEYYPRIERYKTKIIANIAGDRIEDYTLLARHLNELAAIDAVEINISCPNVKKGGIAFGSSPESAAEVTAAVRGAFDRTLLVKLSPNTSRIVDIARSVQDEGADGLTLINTLVGMAIDTDRQSPVLANITGGLSGPAIRPVAVRMVYEVAGSLSVPVIGCGGIMEARDALEFIQAGATAVAVGTASFVNPRATLDIIDGLNRKLSENGCKSIYEMIGAARSG